MKIIYLSIFTLIASSLVAQKPTYERFLKEKNSASELSPKVKPADANKISIWTNDFSNQNDWAIANSTNDNQNWVISTSTSANLGYGMGPFVDAGNNITNENGYALFDSDAVGVNNGNQDATITYTGLIDLTGYNNVVIEFAQRIRKFTLTQTFVGVSIDNGANWTDYELNASKPFSTTFEEMAQVNVSALAGGQDSVKIRFRYIGSWDYAWLVDDVKITEQPNDDVRAFPVYFAGVNNLGIEYGRTPLDQLDSDYEFGGEVYNFGVNDQTNIVIDGGFVNGASSLNFNISPGDLLSGDTLAYSAPSNGFAYEVGTYEGTFTITSDGENNTSPSFTDNVVKRNFAITSNVYSQDGIGVHPQSMLSLASLSSNSFQTTTGTIFSTYYDLRPTSTDKVITGIEIGIANSTNVGTEIQVSIIDTATFFGDGSQPVVDVNGFEALSEYYSVTAQDVSNETVTVYFNQPLTLDPDGYFASVNTMPSTQTNIRILDDQTVLQPSFASMINIPGDGSYTNGNALAIRLLFGNASLDEANNGSFEVYPNPANDEFSIKLNSNSNASVDLLDLNGKIVKSFSFNGTSTKINTANLNDGIYFIRLNNGKNILTKKIIVNK
jgi:hypothetical protein